MEPDGQQFSETALATRRQHSDEDWKRMGKTERKQAVLGFLARKGTVCSPINIYRNLRLQEDMPVHQDTVTAYLKELDEEGLVLRVAIRPLENRRLVPADDTARALYIVSDAGLAEAAQ